MTPSMSSNGRCWTTLASALDGGSSSGTGGKTGLSFARQAPPLLSSSPCTHDAEELSWDSKEHIKATSSASQPLISP